MHRQPQPHVFLVTVQHLTNVPPELFDIKTPCAVSAGLPDELTTDTPTIRQWLGARPKDCRGLEVVGTSMTRAGVEPGDYLICDTSREPYDGCMVIAEVPGEGCVVKRFYGRSLHSDSFDGPGPLIRDFSVVAVVVGKVEGERRLVKRWDDYEAEQHEMNLARYREENGL